MSALPTDAKARKALPVYSGFVKYFPKAMVAVAQLSKAGNDQHNPGKPLHWDRSKSGDEMDAMLRHIVDYAGGVEFDTDGIPHPAKIAWRAMANLEKYLEEAAERAPGVPLIAPGGEPAFRPWRPACGSTPPVSAPAQVEVQLRSGVQISRKAGELRWGLRSTGRVAADDIVAYRVISG